MYKALLTINEVILNNFKAKLVGDQIQLSQHNPQVDQSDVLE